MPKVPQKLKILKNIFLLLFQNFKVHIVNVNATALFLVDINQTALFQPVDVTTSVNVHFTALFITPFLLPIAFNFKQIAKLCFNFQIFAVKGS